MNNNRNALYRASKSGDRGNLPYYASDGTSSPFNKASTAEDVTSGLDLSDKTALITGCSSGIGFETLRVLVLRGAHVFAFARSVAKSEEACARVNANGAKGRATPIGCEQENYESVVAAAEAVRASGIPIDMLICNVGINVPQLEQVRGIEKHFAVHHLSHFILVNRLLDRVRDSCQGRVVMVSSFYYKVAPACGIEFDNLSGERGEYDMFKMYGQSKLANGLFARELARRMYGTAVTANVLHPGLVPTSITRTWSEDSRLAEVAEKSNARAIPLVPSRDITPDLYFIKTLGQGAATTCYVASHPTLRRVSGGYFEDCRIVAPDARMQDDEIGGRLWTISEELTRPYLLRV